MTIQLIVQQLINALSLGSLYALLALGLAVVYSVLGLLNFAYGELVTITGYTMFVLVSAGVPFPIACVAGIVLAGVLSLLTERIAFRPLRGASFITLLFSSFAVALIIQNLIRQIISPRPQGIPIPAVLDEVITFGVFRVGVLTLVTLGIGLVSLTLLVSFLQRSKWGLAMRAAAEDFEVARLMGARANQVIALSFAVSGIVAGIAGVLWVTRRGIVTPQMGFTPILKAFIAVVIGGLGSLRGAALGGFVLAIIETALIVFLPSRLQPFTDAFSLAIVVGILYVRPGGLLGSQAVSWRAASWRAKSIRLSATRSWSVRRLKQAANAWTVVALILTLVTVATVLWGAAPTERLVINFLIVSALVVALQSFVGNSGILSFGHVAFFGVGAYVTAVLTIAPDVKEDLLMLPFIVEQTQQGMLVAVAAAALVAGLIAFLTGLAFTRMEEGAMAMATLALLVMMHTVFNNWEAVTRGTVGVHSIPRNVTLWTALIGALIVVGFALTFKASPSGLRLQAARDDPLAAQTLGISVERVRLIGWVVSALLMGAGGSLWAQNILAFGSTQFFFVETFTLLSMLVIGGLGSVSGAVTGAAVVTLITELVRHLEIGLTIGAIEVPKLPGAVQFTIATSIIIVLVLRPRGLTGQREFRMPHVWGKGS